ncbi:DNA-binding response OmpR family regulator [Ureibacillus thermosphaericus]|uniref:DNA-binding response OmpR family regulator n=1 Tax=Ureibacillus thermosphaericus TaxID=51173 RepID=A0A840PSI8_URETH|nr:DNA-binding response OmpR family regulator [Ureibacillus thermosphaericus]
MAKKHSLMKKLLISLTPILQFQRIYQATNCEEAKQIIQLIKPDLAILDVMLPDGDGFSLLSTIRQYSNIPVIFLTARGEDEDRLLGLGLGADDYIIIKNDCFNTSY